MSYRKGADNLNFENKEELISIVEELEKTMSDLAMEMEYMQAALKGYSKDLKEL